MSASSRRSLLTVFAVLLGVLGLPAGASAAGVVQLDAGFTHTCALKSDGELVCWGDNEYGQLQVPDQSWTTFTAGEYFTCAIRVGGQMYCWGEAEYGATAHPEGAWKAVSGGYLHACGIRTYDSLDCWGTDIVGSTTPPGGTWKALSLGGIISCAIGTDDTLGCWGDDDDGKTSPPSGSFTALASGYGHACAIRADQTLACWGSNEDDATNSPGGTFTAVASGNYHSCAIRTDGTLACWGYNAHGQTDAPDGTWTMIGAGGYHSCGVRTDGRVVCWGYDGYGQLGGVKFTGSAPPNAGSVAYSHTFTATSAAKEPVSFSVTSGTLPDGLALSSAGVLSGTATTEGTYSFEVTADDGFFLPVVRQVTIKVDLTAPPAPSDLASNPTSPSASSTTPKISGHAETGTTVHLFRSSDCSGTAAASGTAAEFSTGIALSVAANSTTAITAAATNSLGNVSDCSEVLTYTHEETPPPAPAPAKLVAKTAKPSLRRGKNRRSVVGTIVVSAPGMTAELCSGTVELGVRYVNGRKKGSWAIRRHKLTFKDGRCRAQISGLKLTLKRRWATRSFRLIVRSETLAAERLSFRRKV